MLTDQREGHAHDHVGDIDEVERVHLEQVAVGVGVGVDFLIALGQLERAVRTTLILRRLMWDTHTHTHTTLKYSSILQYPLQSSSAAVQTTQRKALTCFSNLKLNCQSFSGLVPVTSWAQNSIHCRREEGRSTS